MSMTIYEIDNAITNLIDPETGEILDFEAFDGLQMERGKKIENMALWYKELNAESAAIRNEERTLAERRKALENKAEHLADYLARITDGQKFETPRAAISWRRSTAVELDDDFVMWAKANASWTLKPPKDPEPDKNVIKNALKNGENVYGARLVERYNMQVK